jgi:RNA polymerase sigma factor (sigma-70 family)
MRDRGGKCGGKEDRVRLERGFSFQCVICTISQMETHDSTCWTMIQGAAEGRSEDREHFARLYAPVIREYLTARWGNSGFHEKTDDAVQEVFVECFKQGGALDNFDPAAYGSFRRFLYGVVRNVSLRAERKHLQARELQAPPDFEFDAIERDEETLSKIFDKAWARALVEDAVAIQLERALKQGEEAQKRVEILHLRFHEGLPIREIARLWEVEPVVIHRAYARARRDFESALREVVAFHNPESPENANREFEEVLSLLS